LSLARALQLAADELSPSKAASVGARPGVAKQIVIVFSDGHSQVEPAEAAKQLNALDVTVYTIGMDSTFEVCSLINYLNFIATLCKVVNTCLLLVGL
jgi:hypothetical protein